MFAKWREARRLDNLTREFWNLLGQSEVTAALRFFETSLAP